jgi:hypothetical protein
MSKLEEIEWELVSDVDAVPDKPNKVTTSIYNDSHWNKGKFTEKVPRVRDYFQEEYDLKKRPRVLINPLKLNQDEIKARVFRISDNNHIFDGTIRINDKTSYTNLNLAISYDFSIELKPGFMEAGLVNKEYQLTIMEGYYSNGGNLWSKIYTEKEWEEMTQENIRKIFTSELKRIYSIPEKTKK